MSDSGSDFDEGVSSDFAPPMKAAKAAPKPKAAPKKAAAAPKPRGRPAGTTAAKPKAKAASKKKAKDFSDNENSDVDMEDPIDNDDESLLADTPPKAKKSAAPKKTSGKPLADIANESFGMDGAEEALPSAKGKKAAGGASSKYQMVCRLAQRKGHWS
jgi:DNA topoisomerase-2